MIPEWLERPDPQVYWSSAFEEDRITLDFETDVEENYGHAVEPANGMLMGVYKFRGKNTTIWGNEYDVDWCQLSATFIHLKLKWGFIPLVAHNAGYELAWIKRIGCAELHDFIVWDTKIGEYVLMGNLAAANEKTGEAPRSTSLDSCCIRRGWKVKDPIVDKLMKAGINPAEIPRDWLEGRCIQDVDCTDELFLAQRLQAQNAHLTNVVFTRCIATPCLADIGMTGLKLDEGRVTAAIIEHQKYLDEYEEKFEVLTGGINWQSPKQIRTYLYTTLKFKPEANRGNARLTSSGELPTDKQALAHCETQAVTAAQKEFVFLRRNLNKYGKALQSLRFFDTVCQEKGGIFYGEFNQTKTATHRLASSGRRIMSNTHPDKKGNPKPVTAQLQNLANIFKKLFTARKEGWMMMEHDGSQLEFRVGGWLGDDQQIREDIEDPNFDAHCVSACAMYGLDYDTFLRSYRDGDEEIAKLRKSAKPHTFKPFYGGEQGTEEEMKWYTEFGIRYSGLAGKQAEWQMTVANDKKLVTPWGLRYYFPKCRVNKRTGKVDVKNQVANYPIQALATAEIIPIALVYLWHSVRAEDRVLLTNTVHDSVISEVEPSYHEEYTEHAKSCFTTRVYNYLEIVYGIDFDIPLGLGVTLGTHWSEGEERAYDIYKDGREREIV